MSICQHPCNDAMQEHAIVLRGYAKAQLRCSETLAAQVAEIERLQALTMRLRAQVILTETRLAWALEGAQADAAEDPQQLTASRAEAQWLICRTGCISQGDHWREQDQCKRTRQPCGWATHPEQWAGVLTAQSLQPQAEPSIRVDGDPARPTKQP